MNKAVLNTVLKGVVALAGVGITLAQGYFNKKEQEEVIAKKVAEALAEKAGESK